MLNKYYFLIIFVLVGCGGGGGGGSSSSSNNQNNYVDITGTAFTDALLTGSKVDVKCTNGVVAESVTDQSGAYTVRVNTPQFPCLLKLSGGYSNGVSNTMNIYSVATSQGVTLISLVTNYALRTIASDMDMEFSNPTWSSYSENTLSQAVTNLDSRLSMFGFLSSFDHFKTNTVFEKELIKNLSKSFFYKSKNLSDFITAITTNAASNNTKVSYNSYYANYQFRISSLPDLYWAKAYGVYKSNVLVDWVLYPKSLSDYYSSTDPELYQFIVPSIETNEGGTLDNWVEWTYPPRKATATLFINNSAISNFEFTYTVIDRAWYP